MGHNSSLIKEIGFQIPDICYKWGTCKLASPRFMILTTPSPKMSPLASIITGVSSRPLWMRQYQLTRPPIVRAKVNDGVLYIPSLVSVICRSTKKLSRHFTNGDCNPAGQPSLPPFSLPPYPRCRQRREKESSSQGPLPGHMRQAFTSDQPRGKDPNVCSRHLEHPTRNLIDTGIQFIDTGADNGTCETSNHLSPKLRSR